MQSQRFWYLRDPYAWIVFVLSLVTAAVIGEAWVILLGVIGYQFALLVELTRGRSLGRTGAIRLARAEQEVRELQAEQARLLGGIHERDEKLAALSRDFTEPSQNDSAETGQPEEPKTTPPAGR
jgi:hypothetical protein